MVGVSGGAMPERVRPGMGLLGPVGDAAAMAANIAQVWSGDRRGMGARARAFVAGGFSWAHSMDVLLNQVVPAALERRAERMLAGGTALPALAA